MTHEHLLARNTGDGAAEQIDDMYDGVEYKSKDKRSMTRTTFYKSDIDNLAASRGRKQRLKRILDRHEGIDYGETSLNTSRKQQNRDEWKRRCVGTYASQMDMSSAQKQRCEHLIMDVISVDSFGHYSTEQVALAIVNVVAREDGWFIEDEDDFHELMVHADIEANGKPDTTVMRSLRRLVRERLPNR
jgi:hypothetical protein